MEARLSEGIDLSIFLFGNFENELILMIEKLSNKEFDIIDIGANIGVHTLQFAKNYEKAKIYSIEPTAFAYEKLKKNVDLNLDLKDRIHLFQTFISNKILPEKIFLHGIYPLMRANINFIGGLQSQLTEQ